MLSQKLYTQLDEVIDGFPRLPLTEIPYFRAMLVLQEQIMRASEDLLQLAAPHHPYLAEHVEEERGHHRWIVEDLANLDVHAEAEPTNEVVAQMTGAQYYHLVCGKPLDFFGYLAFLEGYPAAPETERRLKAAFPRSMRTVAYHAKHDIEHRRHLRQILDTLAETHHEGIIANALATAELYKTALWRIIAQEK
jgi:hypothetical protein